MATHLFPHLKVEQKDVTATHIVMCNLYREDKYFADRNFVYFTMIRPEHKKL